ncbi:MAG: type II toxin-antitoxin system VapC family toxin [Campylobacterales bacterium]|nr:type II toxin-antitoxin system VapC family toxin [Campylobacterales bacterium]
MSGKVLLDTNAIIYALNDRLMLPKAHYIVSVITEIELLSYSKLTQDEKNSIKALLLHFEVIDLTQVIKNRTISIRQEYGLKLPDSIIVATAIESNATLVSNDKQLLQFSGLNALKLEEYKRL